MDGREAAARTFVHEALTEQAARVDGAAPGITERLIGDAMLMAGELVTDAATHAGTDVEVTCLLETPDRGPEASVEGTAGPVSIVVEVADRTAPSDGPDRPVGGLRLVSSLAESWGVTYRRGQQTAWFRLEARESRPEARTEAPGTRPADDHPVPLLGGGTGAAWAGRAGSSFLAEASELLAGQLDEDLVAALAGQLLVPRIADWCGVWLSAEAGGMRLSRVWHADERRIDALRAALEKSPPRPGLDARATPWHWPADADAAGAGGTALAVPLVAARRRQGVLLLGRSGPSQMSDDVVRLTEAVARHVAQAVATAHQYTLQATISQVLQRRQLPASLAEIPGVDTAIVYEPSGEGQTVGGDFYDLFPTADGRWCFLLGDVCGSDPEAMSITGLARHFVRLLAREGHGVASVLGRLNAALAEESVFAEKSGQGLPQPRFLSLLYGELKPDRDAGGAHCTIASAGHPLPLRLSSDGSVAPAADPQMLLGIDENAEFHADSFDLAPGETLLCVTDGVTERRSGTRQLDDDDGLAEVLRGCTGLGAKAVAERVRSAAHDFDPAPVEDDLAVLVLDATPLNQTAP